MNKIFISVAAIVGLFIVIALMPFVTVPTGTVGLVKEFNAYQGKQLAPGFHFIVPFKDSVVDFNCQTQAYPIDGVQTYTKEGQVVTVRATLQYNVPCNLAGMIFTEIGMNYEAKVIRPVVEETIKEELAQYTAIELPTNRNTVSGKVETSLRARLISSHINVIDFTYDNEDFSDDYENAIREKQVQEQKALEAKNVTAQVEEKTKQEKLQADAQAYKTQKEVEALRIGGAEYVLKLNAEATKIQAEAQLEFARHWQGAVPQSVTIIGGSDGVNTVPYLLPLK